MLCETEASSVKIWYAPTERLYSMISVGETSISGSSTPGENEITSPTVSLVVELVTGRPPETGLASSQRLSSSPT